MSNFEKINFIKLKLQVLSIIILAMLLMFGSFYYDQRAKQNINLSVTQQGTVVENSEPSNILIETPTITTSQTQKNTQTTKITPKNNSLTSSTEKQITNNQSPSLIKQVGQILLDSINFEVNLSDSASAKQTTKALKQKYPEDNHVNNLDSTVQSISDPTYGPELQDILTIMNRGNNLQTTLAGSLNKILIDIENEDISDDILNYMLDQEAETGNFGGIGPVCYDDPNPNNLQNGINTYAFCCDEPCCDSVPCLPSCEDQANGNNYIYDYETLDCGIDF
ncbi:MAG: hypothetical protein COU81_01485 [Candidatus Portnoybacteria bacterium CG10_big_fil_rev_8_21_14_0_10_36_7]|uniref:Uncharacterized protein n=1 Tax=Candidatus Portnoybacteria bacterium CG10_big_fil_rev_8_21_14_0_10_36_7 TaxID=1974812 RepID=A0A2M8KEG4_9BACT|nr:MAG: hypothetical protein COU81_01485 [Candidatus Portnoybacteria bacterium CG10_big_fil_rev_8_21_14_0_10_36_7]